MSKKLKLLPRVEYINLILYITLLSCRISAANGQLSNIVEKSRNIIASDGDIKLGEQPIEINLNDDDEAEEEGEAEVADDLKKFSWKTHQDDHSIYAHRSLMSSANIKRPRLADETPDDLEDEEGAPKIKPGDTDEELAPLKTIDFAEKEWQLMFRSFDMMFDGISSSLIQELGQRTNLLKEVISRLKPECRRDIEHIRRSVKQHKLWALRLVDSFGKIPSGITYGKFSSPGDYEECLSVRVNENIHTPISGGSSSSNQEKKKRGTAGVGEGGNNFALEHHKFHGKYCLIDFRLPLPEKPKDKLLSIHDPIIDLAKTDVGKQFPSLQNYSGYASVFYEVGYMHAVCLPSSCEVTDLTRSLGKALEGLHIIVNNTIDCEERFDERPPWRTSQIIATSLLVILFVNTAFATTMRYISQQQIANKKKFDDRNNNNNNNNKQGDGGWQEWVTRTSSKNKLYSDCFSIQTNFERLSKPDPRGLTFVHYTRIVAMALTVITHTAGLGTLQAITKPADASNSEQIFRDFIPQMLANAFTSIQIFFFMAGFMLVISTYPSINREKGHVSFLEYAIKRAIRLMPGLAATICINFLWPLFVDGPMLSYFIRLIVVPCEINWWRTMAFLSNFDHVEKMCLRHSYFSASDYQLHIVAFPLLILLYKQPNISLLIAGILTVGGFVAQVIMILTKTVLPFMMVDYIDKETFFNVVHYIHHPSWNHMSAFFYGFIIGYLVVKQIRINLSETTIKRLWYTILPLGIGSIFAPYFWNHYKRPIYRWQMVLYVLFDRFALLTACAWLSYATMVLGRKPATKKSAADNKQPLEKEAEPARSNLPNIVALASAELEKSSNQANIEQGQKLASSTNLILPQDRLRTSSTTSLTNGTSNLMRQRSSPNFQEYKQENQSAPTTPTLRPAISSSDVHSQEAAKDHAASSRQQPVASSQADRPDHQKEAPAGPDKEPSPGGPTEQKRPPSPISNVNTLCLILSRLTFQLYLFNMVVLWVDVNHSKYYWFFSYYFIITKALAIYICSSLMALIFFITLESPSLTLYIMWVRSRAQARADKRTGASSKSDNNNNNNQDKQSSDKSNAFSGEPVNIQVIASPKLQARRHHGSHKFGREHNNGGSDQFSGSSDGLNMRMGSPVTATSCNLEKPTFSYIDLSTPSNAEIQHVTPTTGSSFMGTLQTNCDVSPSTIE